MLTLLCSSIIIYIASCQCNSPPLFTGVEFRVVGANNAESTDQFLVTVYHEFTIYECDFGAPDTTNKYYTCTTANPDNCCSVAGLYCDPINHGRLILEITGDDALVIEEIIILTTNNGDDCSDIKYGIINWCIDNNLLATTGPQQGKLVTTLDHCAADETHMFAIIIRDAVNYFPIVETNYIEGDFSTRPFIANADFVIDSTSCNPSSSPSNNPSSSPSNNPSSSPSNNPSSSPSNNPSSSPSNNPSSSPSNNPSSSPSNYPTMPSNNPSSPSNNPTVSDSDENSSTSESDEEM
eukprot:41507_1